MTNIKRLADYAKGICPLFADLNWKERVEYETTLNEDGASLYTDFIDVEERDGKMVWKHSCTACPQGTIHETVHDVEEDFMYLSSTPTEEEYDHDFSSAVLCRAMIIQLRDTFGKEPEGARLSEKFEAGQDGYEVVCYWNSRYPMSYAYAMMLESNMPEHWSQAARDYLSHIKGE